AKGDCQLTVSSELHGITGRGRPGRAATRRRFEVSAGGLAPAVLLGFLALLRVGLRLPVAHIGGDAGVSCLARKYRWALAIKVGIELPALPRVDGFLPVLPLADVADADLEEREVTTTHEQALEVALGFDAALDREAVRDGGG